MPIYIYEARNRDGQKIKSQIESSDKTTAIDKLSNDGYYVIKITQQTKKVVFKKKLFSFGKIKTETLILFSRQLATMLRAGIPLITSLSIIIKQTEEARLRKVVITIRDDINGGSGLAEALSKYPAIFSEIYVNTIRVGEETGNIEEILDRLASFAEWQGNFESRIKASLFYPVTVVIVAIGVVVFLLTFVLPKFAVVFAKVNVPLPLITKIMLNIGDFLRRWWVVIVIGIIGSITGLTMFKNTPRGRFFFDRLQFKIPIVKSLMGKVVILRFCRSLEIMLRNGVNILKSLEVVGNSVGNVVIEQVLNEVSLNIHKGGGVAEILRESVYFPPMVVTMIAVGEETGSLDSMLTEVADNYDRQIEYISRNFTMMIEPVMLIFLAVVVGLIAASLFLPIFQFMKVIK